MSLDDSIRGVVAVAATPFRDDDTVDFDSVRRYVDRALADGVAGFLVPAMAGEVQNLTDDERKQIVETVVRRVDGRVPVIGGATSPDQRTRVSNAQALLRAGCDGILVYIPFADEESYVSDFHEMAETRPPFLVLQDNDSTGPGVPVPVIARLFEEIEILNWAKVEVVGRCHKFTELLEKAGPGLQIATAGTQMIEALDRGVVAYMPTVLHDIYGRVYALHRAGDREAARRLFYRLLPIIAFMGHHPAHGIRFNKTVLFHQGVFKTTHVRRNPAPFDRFEQRIADELALEAVELSRSIGS